jgi:hypothetical protein
MQANFQSLTFHPSQETKDSRHSLNKPRKERAHSLFLGLVGTPVKGGRQEAGHSSSPTKAELEGEFLVVRVIISAFSL